MLNQIIFFGGNGKSHRSNSSNLANQHRKRNSDGVLIKFPHKEQNLRLLVDWQIRDVFDVLQTFSLDLSAVTEIIYSACFLTTEDGIFIFNADDSAANAAERFVDGSDGEIFVDVTFVDGVDAQEFTASGVTMSGTSGNSATVVPRGKQTL